MDAQGARALTRRIEQQQHWRQAPAVRDGRQPPVDPDGAELEELSETTRLYGREVRAETVDGRRALVTRRMQKRLVDGWWRTEEVVERVDDCVAW
jgi:hypothetical protein